MVQLNNEHLFSSFIFTYVHRNTFPAVARGQWIFNVNSAEQHEQLVDKRNMQL